MQGGSLAGKVALVTGAGRGIGLAVAWELGRRGARVMVNDAGFSIRGEPEDPELAFRVAAQLRAEGIEAEGSAVALGTFAASETLVAETERAFGPVDILVNNAAILQDRMVFNLTPESWDRVLQNNLHAAFYTLRLVAPKMRQRQFGRIINMVSSAGLVGNLGQANYGASKGGLAALSRIAALDLARYGVTVNAIAPFAHTRVTEIIPPNTPALVDYLATVKNVSLPESVAKLCAFLALESTNVITGQIFGVRGREVFLFSQPRPIGVQVAPEGEGLSDAFLQEAVRRWEEGYFTPLETDLELMSVPFPPELRIDPAPGK
jgi:NAD(P)-dependent dehydrogenase (short-subunit alcohol dehydrogenase family)